MPPFTPTMDAQAMLATMRRAAKAIPPLYWLGGAINYLRFLGVRRRHDRAYDPLRDPTLPPPMLRYRVHRSFDPTGYQQAGEAIATQLIDTFAQMDAPLAGQRVLDFACGPGRVLRFVKELEPTANLYGTDTDAQAITWAARQLGGHGAFSCNAQQPPLDFADGFFDAIYCISLFTHIDEDAQDAWLGELVRVLRPGGLLLATVHGKLTYPGCTAVELQQLTQRGIVFRVEHAGRLKLDGLPASYQTTFHTREYVFAHWSRFAEIVRYTVGGLQNHQDLIVLTRRAL